MNPISAISWLWKALRGHSVTFAVLMAFAILGISVIRWLKLGLYAVGTPWLVALILPTILIGVLARREREWIPEEARRKFWARSILGASLGLAVAMVFLKPEKSGKPAPPPTVSPANTAGSGNAEPVAKPMRPRGPSGK